MLTGYQLHVIFKERLETTTDMVSFLVYLPPEFNQELVYFLLKIIFESFCITQWIDDVCAEKSTPKFIQILIFWLA